MRSFPCHNPDPITQTPPAPQGMSLQLMHLCGSAMAAPLPATKITKVLAIRLQSSNACRAVGLRGSLFTVSNSNMMNVTSCHKDQLNLFGNRWMGCRGNSPTAPFCSNEESGKIPTVSKASNLP